MPLKGIYRILVCRPNHRLGNTLLLTPLVAELERTFRGAEIDILSEGQIATEVFSTCFSVKNIYCLPRRGFKHPFAFLAMLLRIRKIPYDLIIDPCLGSNFSRAMTKFLHGRNKLGFDDHVGVSGLTHAVPRSVATRHMAKRALNLVRWIDRRTDADGDSDEFPSMNIRLTANEHAQGRRMLDGILPSGHRPRNQPVVGIFANATGAKRYSQTWWREFIAALVQRLPHASIVEFLPMHGRSMLDSEWPAYYSSDIRRMGAVMAAVDLLVSADCGVMHLAVASGVPTVGLFCVTDPAVYEPYGQQNRALQTGDLSARECAGRIIDCYAGALTRSTVVSSVDPRD
jgi:heptosyltransferase-3